MLRGWRIHAWEEKGLHFPACLLVRIGNSIKKVKNCRPSLCNVENSSPSTACSFIFERKIVFQGTLSRDKSIIIYFSQLGVRFFNWNEKLQQILQAILKSMVVNAFGRIYPRYCIKSLLVCSVSSKCWQTVAHLCPMAKKITTWVQ